MAVGVRVAVRVRVRVQVIGGAAGACIVAVAVT